MSKLIERVRTKSIQAARRGLTSIRSTRSPIDRDSNKRCPRSSFSVFLNDEGDGRIAKSDCPARDY